MNKIQKQQATKITEKEMKTIIGGYVIIPTPPPPPPPPIRPRK